MFDKIYKKHLCQSLCFDKVTGRACTFIKNRGSGTGVCFPVNFVKFLRTPFLQNTSG